MSSTTGQVTARPCIGRTKLYDDALWPEQGADPAATRQARSEASALCATCPDVCPWAATPPEHPMKHRPSCGTVSGYKLHRRHYEAACGPCAGANARQSAARREAKRTTPTALLSA